MKTRKTYQNGKIVEDTDMKKGYRISSYTREMLERYGSWDAGRYHYEVNEYATYLGTPRKALVRNGVVIDYDFKVDPPDNGCW